MLMLGLAILPLEMYVGACLMLQSDIKPNTALQIYMTVNKKQK